MNIPKPNPAIMTLYSSFDAISCHCVRFVVAEKDIEASIYNIDIKDMPEEVLELNPYQTLPTLYDRELVLYDVLVMLEYLDERFPFPPLMPVDPIERAETRQLLFRLFRAEDSWYNLVQTILYSKVKKDKEAARKKFKAGLIQLIPLFESQKYFKSDTLTVLDVFLGTVLLRLKKMEIELPPKAKPIYDYAQRIFAKQSFQKSLTDGEKEYLW
ncbi:Stringent starvation protein A [hydrothermal vent metagenome]|uniref:Stringent starvation protein A n=1 Tax=hydrothermal vent metagenome TaxID=652676 RepID=A0A1W1CT80_9ZZZZ